LNGSSRITAPVRGTRTSSIEVAAGVVGGDGVVPGTDPAVAVPRDQDGAAGPGGAQPEAVLVHERARGDRERPEKTE